MCAPDGIITIKSINECTITTRTVASRNRTLPEPPRNITPRA